MAIPARIDRFRIIRELGRGSQGVVYLAEDLRLERKVAIKTLDVRASGLQGRQSRLMQEARIVSKLQHPNIVTLYEAGELNGKPYLVFEYVEGISLRDMFKREGIFPVHRAIDLMMQILSGIGYAHEHRVVHRDLNPNNIMIDKKAVPRLMDFGISVLTGAERDMAGTPCYMSPEHFSQDPLGPPSDIFSLGLVFYEMLVGEPAFQADNHYAVLYKIAFDQVQPPSLKNSAVDRKLEAIVMKALEKKPEMRYARAQDMKEALETYLKTDTGEKEPAAPSTEMHSTVEFLLRRMRSKSDFPAFSRHVIEINRKASSSEGNYTSASDLANLILKDYSITNKLLKLVNSAFYGRFAGNISTVSRAVVVLGFEQVRMAAASLMLFDHLQSKEQATELQESAISSFMSGLIAGDLARNTTLKSKEEAFICSMLHRLGRHLAIFYFPEEYKEIKNKMEQKGIGEDKAVRAVLGIPYDELGMAVLKVWNFPDRMISSMVPVGEGEVEPARSETDMLRTLSSFSNELCDIVKSTEGRARAKALTDITNRFKRSLPVSEKHLGKLLEAARAQVEKYSDVLNIEVGKNDFLRRFTPDSKEADREAPPRPGAAVASPAQTHRAAAVQRTASASEQDFEDHLKILINGIQEITNVLLGNYELNEVMFMILETMYRGFGFNRVVFCMKSGDRTRMTARSGFGQDIENVLTHFTFRLSSRSDDIFNVSIGRGEDFLIEDSTAPDIRARIPDWYRSSVAAPAFALYPLAIKGMVIGLFYADRDCSGSIVPENHLNYMKTLRAQAVLAVKQKV